jgi:type IV pilus assembly protein PilA
VENPNMTTSNYAHGRDRLRTGDEGGFTLIELLVVILIIGILAAIAIPAFLSQKSKAYDSSAKTVAQTAQTAAETYATENGGSYEGISPTKLKEIEPSLNITNTKEADLTTAKGTTTTYEVTATAQNTEDKYTVKRETSGEVKHKCQAPTGGTGCPGHANSSESW